MLWSVEVANYTTVTNIDKNQKAQPTPTHHDSRHGVRLSEEVADSGTGRPIFDVAVLASIGTILRPDTLLRDHRLQD